MGRIITSEVRYCDVWLENKPDTHYTVVAVYYPEQGIEDIEILDGAGDKITDVNPLYESISEEYYRYNAST